MIFSFLMTSILLGGLTKAFIFFSLPPVSFALIEFGMNDDINKYKIR